MRMYDSDADSRLPVVLSSFVGRYQEIVEVERLLDETRLITLTGTGGGGKTHLALVVAANLAERNENRSRWVALGSLHDPDLLPQTVASALDISRMPGLSPTEALCEYLGRGKTLLVLDDCGHLVAACAALVETLLVACPGLCILVTSREPLGIVGEATWAVPPLSFPPPEVAPAFERYAGYEAIKLFVERAKTAVPSFEITPENASVVAGICRRLDGIPLAIEFAAARMSVLSEEQILCRLDDCFGLLTNGGQTSPTRRQSLRATIDWSYDLLSEEERALFRRLSVFSGGFTLEAIEWVCAGDDLGREDILDVLSHLVDKSLVFVAERKGEIHYRFLQTVWQYAREKLAESGEEGELRRRHGIFFLGFSEQAEAGLAGPEQQTSLERLELELDNLRNAVKWSTESAESEVCSRLAGALWRFCYLKGHYDEGRAWLEGALMRPGDYRPAVRAKASVGAGVLAFLQCEYGTAGERLQEALRIYRDLEDERGVASALQVLGSISRERGDYEQAEAYHEESLATWRRLGEEREVARSFNYLGLVAWLRGEHDRATGLSCETLETFKNLGDAEGTTWALVNLGSAALHSGAEQRAAELLSESLSISRKAGYREGVGWSLNQLGLISYRHADHAQAADMLCESLGAHRDLGDKWRMASVLEALAEVACAQGHLGRSARLFGAAEALRETIGAPVPPCERPEYARCVAAASTGMDEKGFAAAWALGRAAKLEDTVAYTYKLLREHPKPAADSNALSARELEVLRLVGAGLTDSQVAQRLYLSPRTVSQHLRSIYRKFGVPSRAAAVHRADEAGLL